MTNTDACGKYLLILLATIGTGLCSEYCSSYCDRNGYYSPGFSCGSRPDTFCCGDRIQKHCCSNSTASIGGKYPDVRACPGSAWWFFHWEILIGVLGSLIIILLLAACCCQCCTGFGRPARLQRRTCRQNNRRDTPGNAPPETEARDSREPRAFDPASPYAFVPPPYESLSKDPPKYSQIFNVGGEASGTNNEAFEGDNIGSTLPPYFREVPVRFTTGNEAISLPVYHVGADSGNSGSSSSTAATDGVITADNGSTSANDVTAGRVAAVCAPDVASRSPVGEGRVIQVQGADNSVDNSSTAQNAGEVRSSQTSHV